MARGLLLLDVDGPLNPYAAKPTRRPDGYRTYRRTQAGGWREGRPTGRTELRVWLHPGHGGVLLDLAAETGLQLVWATTWMDEANTRIGSAIGLPTLPVITFPATDLDSGAGWNPSGNWKWAAVTEYAAGRPLAWLDDELVGDRGYAAARAVFDQARCGTPTLLCQVDPARGLLDEHTTAVRDWAAKLPATRL